MKKPCLITVGLLLILASLWLGALGQELNGFVYDRSYYVLPALITSAILFISGVALIGFALSGSCKP